MTLNIPPFLSEIRETEQIARLRKHVERMNKRIKENHLFDSAIPMSLAGSINQLWTVVCLLANCKGPVMVKTTESRYVDEISKIKVICLIFCFLPYFIIKKYTFQVVSSFPPNVEVAPF